VNHCASSVMKHIETAHRFCVKHMQRFSKYTNTVFSYLTIDLVPVQLPEVVDVWTIMQTRCILFSQADFCTSTGALCQLRSTVKRVYTRHVSSATEVRISAVP